MSGIYEPQSVGIYSTTSQSTGDNSITPFQPWLTSPLSPDSDYKSLLGYTTVLPTNTFTPSYSLSWSNTQGMTTSYIPSPCYLPLDPPQLHPVTTDGSFLLDQTRPSSVLSTDSTTSSISTCCSTSYTNCTQTAQTDSHDQHSDSDSNNRPQKKRKKRADKYRRYPKPPYSFCGLIITAIQNSPNQRLTLSGIHSKLMELFNFFRGEYTGWRDSVRHNLSHNSCFYKVPYPCPGEDERTGKMNGRRNYWKVNMSKAPKNVFKILDKKAFESGNYKQYIHEELGLPEINVPEETQIEFIPTSTDNPATELKNHLMTPHTRYSMRLPHMTSCCNSTESPEQFRLRDPTLHDNTPIKLGYSDDAPTSKRPRLQGPSMNDEEARRTSEIDELLNYVKCLTGVETNSADAVNNLSTLCDPDME